MSRRVVVVDTGLGNLRSVLRALEEAGRRAGLSATVAIETSPDAVRAADAIVVPGQGAFRDCTRVLDAGIGDALREAITSGTKYLGLCLGLQVLFESSEEAPGCAGLGIFRGPVRKLGSHADASGRPLKVPHVGWNVVEPTARRGLLAPKAEHFYFVHSYVVAPEDESIVAGTTTHGERFVSAVMKDNVMAVQFHPEKSQAAGLALLERFLRW